MRVLNPIASMFFFLIGVGRVAHIAWSGGHRTIPAHKGGGPEWRVFEFLPGKYPFHKEKMSSLSKDISTDSHPANLLMRAANWVREGGQVHPISEDPTAEESLGILFNIVRRRKKISLEALSLVSGLTVEELIAFEAGMLPGLRIREILPDLTRGVGMDPSSLLPRSPLNNP